MPHSPGLPGLSCIAGVGGWGQVWAASPTQVPLTKGPAVCSEQDGWLRPALCVATVPFPGYEDAWA